MTLSIKTEGDTHTHRLTHRDVHRREQEKQKQLSFFFLFLAPPSPSSSLSSLLSSGKSVSLLLSLPLFPDAASGCCSVAAHVAAALQFLLLFCQGFTIDGDTRNNGEDPSLFPCSQRRGQTLTKSSVKEPRLPGSPVVVARRKVVRRTDRRTRDGLLCS
jgi:hypothetical protein